MLSTAPDGLIQRCAGLVRVALDSTDPERLIAAAANELGWPLLLLDDDGVPLVTAPQPAGATTWLAGPRAPRQDGVNVPPGWIVFPIENERERLGFLVVHAGPALKAGERATELATYEEKWGDWHKLFHYLKELNEVTPADVQRMSTDTFRSGNRVVGILRHPETAAAAQGGSK